MAKTLQQILAPDTISEVMDRLRNGPVHWLENVDGDPKRVQTACRRYGWTNMVSPVTPLDPNRATTIPVTCPECLAAMADTPVVVVDSSPQE